PQRLEFFLLNQHSHQFPGTANCHDGKNSIKREFSSKYPAQHGGSKNDSSNDALSHFFLAFPTASSVEYMKISFGFGTQPTDLSVGNLGFSPPVYRWDMENLSFPPLRNPFPQLLKRFFAALHAAAVFVVLFCLPFAFFIFKKQERKNIV